VNGSMSPSSDDPASALNQRPCRTSRKAALSVITACIAGALPCRCPTVVEDARSALPPAARCHCQMNSKSYREATLAMTSGLSGADRAASARSRM
jgi:hypothetical protein